MRFISTRNTQKIVSASEAISHGISEDGGLFVPADFPLLGEQDFIALCGMDYAERAAFVLSKYLTDYDYDRLKAACEAAYSKFEENDAAPLMCIDEGLYVLELFHGPTLAFKDMALTLLPFLLREGCNNIGIKEKVLILVATSGDTGKAALEGFKDAEGIKIMVFYPSEGVSDMQKLQMCTQEGENVSVVAVKGNFDDCQSAVKNIFNDANCIESLKKQGYIFSSANSINFGRLAPQIAYYFSAYCDLVNAEEIELGDKVNFVVPTGNFGNILAAYYAKKMGLPVEKLLCASNKNNILTDFFHTGEYDTNREFYKTTSPSMDILISSNLERLLFELFDRDSDKTAAEMRKLKEEGKYAISEELLNKLNAEFYGGYCDEDENAETVSYFYDEYHYALDTHTANAVAVLNQYQAETEDMTPVVVVSTASPYKFAADVLKAISGKKVEDAFKAAAKLEELTAVELPEGLATLRQKPVRFTDVKEKDELIETVLAFAD